MALGVCRPFSGGAPARIWRRRSSPAGVSGGIIGAGRRRRAHRAFGGGTGGGRRLAAAVRAAGGVGHTVGVLAGRRPSGRLLAGGHRRQPPASAAGRGRRRHRARRPAPSARRASGVGATQAPAAPAQRCRQAAGGGLIITSPAIDYLSLIGIQPFPAPLRHQHRTGLPALPPYSTAPLAQSPAIIALLIVYYYLIALITFAAALPFSTIISATDVSALLKFAAPIT